MVKKTQKSNGIDTKQTYKKGTIMTGIEIFLLCLGVGLAMYWGGFLTAAMLAANDDKTERMKR